MKFLLILAAVLGIAAVGSANSFAVTDTYMQDGTIQGSSTAVGHENWIVLDSLQLGVAVPVSSPTSGIGSVGAPKFDQITITKTMDQSSPALLQQLLQGQAQTITIDLTQPSNFSKGPVTFAEYKLTDAVLTAYSVSSGGDTPTESLSIAFQKFSYTFTPHDSSGIPGTPVTVTWDLTTNRP